MDFSGGINMFISQIKFSRFSHSLLRVTCSAYEMHRFIMSAFPDDLNDERILFSSQKDGVLIQSPIMPNWDKSKTKYDFIDSFAVKSFDPDFNKDQLLRFRIDVNPTEKIRVPGKNNCIIHSINSEPEIIKWMIRKGDSGGFKIANLIIRRISKENTYKKDQCITFGTALLEGRLKVADPVLFAETMKNGIGRSKGFGMGMLMVANEISTPV
jgi:CRISPR system Cascade subunit CasE